MTEQDKSEGFDSCDRPSNLAWIGFESSIFHPGWPWNLMDDLEKTIGHLSHTTSSFVNHFKATDELKLESKSAVFFCPRDVEIRRMTLKNKRASVLRYLKLWASFRSHLWIQTGVTVQWRPIWVKVDNLLSHVILKFDEWPWKAIGHLFNATRNLKHHFVAIGEVKLELPSVRKPPIWVKTGDFLSRVTLKFDEWP